MSMDAEAAGLLDAWLARQAPPAAMAWLADARRRVATGGARELGLAFGLAPRRVGKEDLRLTAADREAASAARPGWRPWHWSLDEAARCHLLLTVGSGAWIGDLFVGAEVNELAALCRSLAVLPGAATLVDRAVGVLRSSVTCAFAALAQHNPFPAERFPENAWNQMVLKALFTGVALRHIEGLDGRANPELARMLVDYAHERWAAGRPVPPELWRCAAPFPDRCPGADLRRVLAAPDPTERRAGALACHQRDPALLADHPDLATAIAGGTLTWDTL
jgi:hypothetical protein